MLSHPPGRHVTHLLAHSLRKVAISRPAGTGRTVASREAGFRQARAPGRWVGGQAGAVGKLPGGGAAGAPLACQLWGPTVPGGCTPLAGPCFLLPGGFLALGLRLCLKAWAPGEALRLVCPSEAPPSRCGSHLELACWPLQGQQCSLQMVKSGCTSGPVSQPPGQGAPSRGGCYTSPGRTQ